MKVKTVRNFVLLLLTALLCVSCTNNTKAPENDTKGEKDTVTNVFPIENLQGYTIVRPDVPDTDVDEAVMLFRTEVKKLTGIEMPVTNDFVKNESDIPVGTLEILIGDTNRPESKPDETLAALDYYIAFKNERLVITGGTGAGVLEGVKYYIANYMIDTLLCPNTAYLHRDKTFQFLSEEKLQEFRAETDARIEEILNTPNMTIPANATVYYISNSGSDSGDGRSPATAWKTIDKLNSTALSKGSFVCFERGGVFRGNIKAQIGVTYTAYGEGEKPKLYSSPFNAADPTLWTQTDTPNVWLLKTNNQDVGTLVFNEGEQFAIKVLPYYASDKTTIIKDATTGKAFSSYKDLDTDLQFYHEYWRNNGNSEGLLYMYSVQNPGDRFDSIELNTCGYIFSVPDGTDYVTIDNLCLKYTGGHAVGANTVKGLTVQNCEFGWIGGSIKGSRTEWETRPEPTLFGNAVQIYGGCDGFSVTNNYIYQVFDAGITQQYRLTDADIAENKKISQKNINYSYNVLEYCSYAIEYYISNLPEDNPSEIENFYIGYNHMWYSGEGWDKNVRPNKGMGAHIRGWEGTNRNRAKNFVIEENLLAFAPAQMVVINSGLLNSDGEDSMPTFENNQFIGTEGQRFGCVTQGEAVRTTYDVTVKDYLGERSKGDIFWFYQEDK